MGDAGKMVDEDYLALALAEATESMKEGGIPVSIFRPPPYGCVLPNSSPKLSTDWSRARIQRWRNPRPWSKREGPKGKRNPPCTLYTPFQNI